MDPVSDDYKTFLTGLKEKDVKLSINQISDLFSQAGNRDAFFTECLKNKMRKDFLEWWSKNTVKLRVLGEKEKISLLTILTAILMLDADPSKALQSMNLIAQYLNNSDVEVDDIPNNSLLMILYRLYSVIDNAESAYRACSVFYSSVEISTNVAEPMGGELLEDNEKYTEYVLKGFVSEKAKRPSINGPAAFVLHLLKAGIITSTDANKLIVGRIDAGMYELKEVYVLDREDELVDATLWAKMAEDFADDSPSAYTVATWNAPDIDKQWVDTLFDGLTGFIPITNNHLDFTKIITINEDGYEIHSLIDKDTYGTINTTDLTYTDGVTGKTRDLEEREIKGFRDFEV
jgi:hypothetical protein